MREDVNVFLSCRCSALIRTENKPAAAPAVTPSCESVASVIMLKTSLNKQTDDLLPVSFSNRCTITAGHPVREKNTDTHEIILKLK